MLVDISRIYNVVNPIVDLSYRSDEGVYAWVVANYALGTLGGDPSETTGIIELGGASAQNVAHDSWREAIISGDLNLVFIVHY
ncbi:putative apyrase 6-like protein [Trifolium pratense]|uniref:Putative apyrase 6-like protein n=1 Tax=Trifolium pratense TaxID=57577 RepID=A0A2K3JWC1_TRIPR|nr:putative apyrase 6-like protein [Trifolium pratense]